MLMRYHWGLGIGHKYSWDAQSAEEYDGGHSGSFSITACNGENIVGGGGETCRQQDSEESILEEDPNMVVEDGRTVEDNTSPDEDKFLDELQETEGHYLDDGMEDLENEDLGDEDSEGDY